MNIVNRTLIRFCKLNIGVCMYVPSCLVRDASLLKGDNFKNS